MYAPDQQYRLLEVAARADALGVDFVDVTDHVLMGEGALTSGHGWQPHHLEMAIPEPLTTLAAMAGCTERIKLLSAVVIAPLRPAGLLAKQAATLHALSQGRFVMGVSVAGTRMNTTPWEFRSSSAARCSTTSSERVGSCGRRRPPASTAAPSTFDNMYCSPRPLEHERIPIWFGGFFTPKLIRRVTELGDGWLLYGGLGMSLAQKADAIAQLKQAFTAANRNTSELELCDEVDPLNGDLGRSMAQFPTWQRRASPRCAST